MNKYGFEIVPYALEGEPIPGLTDKQDRRLRTRRQGMSCMEIALAEGVSRERVRVGILRAEEILSGK